jgi:hypothetical protein
MYLEILDQLNDILPRLYDLVHAAQDCHGQESWECFGKQGLIQELATVKRE